MHKVFKYFLIINLFVFQSNFVFSNKIESVCDDLSLQQNNKSKTKFLHIKFNSCSESEQGDVFLLELENISKSYSGFLIVSDKYLFNRFFSEDSLKNDLYNEIKKSNYLEEKNKETKDLNYIKFTKNLGTFLKNYKFVKAGDLVVGDKLKIAKNRFLIKNIYNIEKSAYLKSNFLIEDRHSFFYFGPSKCFHINNFFSLKHLAFLTLGVFHGTSLGLYFFPWEEISFKTILKKLMCGGLIGASVMEVLYWIALYKDKVMISNSSVDLVLSELKNKINLIKIDFVNDKDSVKKGYSDIEYVKTKDGNFITDKKGNNLCLFLKNI